MRKLLEIFIRWFCNPIPLPHDFDPKTIFILRNNDLGDYLLITPLLRELKKSRPNTKIYLGIGSWAIDLAKNNPFIDAIVICDAPWHNKQVCHYPANSFEHWVSVFKFLFFSPTLKNLKDKRVDLGIDILGSPEGSLLMKFAKIKYRFGVRGYAGGHSGCQKYIQHKIDEHVGRMSLKNLELLNLNITKKIDTSPEIYLDDAEKKKGLLYWKTKKPNFHIIIAPGGGFEEKCWPRKNYSLLIDLLKSCSNLDIIILGGNSDDKFLNLDSPKGNIQSLCGKTTLRETCAIVSHANLVICNSSFMMHCAAAFDIPALILLGEWYDSTILHNKQWGHSTSILLGKEISMNKDKLTSPEEVIKIILEYLNRLKQD